MISTESTSLFRNYIVWILYINTNKIYWFRFVIPGHCLSSHYYAIEYDLYHIVITATFLQWHLTGCFGNHYHAVHHGNITAKYSCRCVYRNVFNILCYTWSVYIGHGWLMYVYGTVWALCFCCFKPVLDADIFLFIVFEIISCLRI